jgi:hypothetical protein
MLAGSNAALIGATYQNGAWATTALNDSTPSGIPDLSITMDSGGNGVGVYASASSNPVNQVGFTTWSGNSWTTAALIPGAYVTRSEPTVDATGSATAYALFQDPTLYSFYSLTFDGVTWSSATQLMSGSSYDYGPQGASIAAVTGGAVAGFIDGRDGNATADAVYSGGAWGSVFDITGVYGEDTNVPAVVIPLDGGGASPELMMVWNDGASPQQIDYATGTGSTWSSGQQIPTCLTNDRVGLAPLPGGGAILAFAGTDGNLYWTTYSEASGWAAVLPLSSTGQTATDTTPAVTHGINGDIAEMVYLSGGHPVFSSLTASGWSSPRLVNTSMGLTGVAIASAP